MENAILWSLIREDGKKILESPKYINPLKEIADEVKALKLKDPKILIHFSAEKAKIIRKDVLRREAEDTDFEGAREHAIENYKDYDHFTLEELLWLDSWAVSYLMACNGDWEADGIAGHPKGITDEDYIQYYIVGGLPPDNWERAHPMVSYCATFQYAASIRRKALKKTKITLIRDYLTRHPDGDGTLPRNQIPDSFPEIAGTVQLHELVTFWRNQRQIPRLVRQAVSQLIRDYTDTHNGDLPSCGKDCLPLIKNYPHLSELEPRIVSNIDRRLNRRAETNSFTSLLKERTNGA